MKLSDHLAVKRLDSTAIVVTDTDTGHDLVVTDQDVSRLISTLEVMQMDANRQAVDRLREDHHRRLSCLEAQTTRHKLLCQLPQGHKGQHQEIYRWGPA